MPTSTPNPTARTVRISATQNQRRVIEDKYLKGAPSIESWLLGVARNIAFAELLYHPSMPKWGLFDGARVFKKETPSADGGNPIRTWLFHGSMTSAAERDSNFRRFIENCQRATEREPEAKEIVDTWAQRFFDLMASWRFLPNSPTLMNAGRELQQLSACYVLPIEDSLEGITGALQAQALIHKSGGGTGFSFEKIRPAGDLVRSTSGVASGVVSFMRVFDRMTEVVKQGGNRRGANMAILPYWHPEIKDFIKIKSRPGVMENFNISVSVDSKFMEAVKQGWEYDLLNPRTKQPVGRASARDIFNTIVENAWKSGDPGIVFIDTINNSGSNPTPQLGQITSTNPCGEQPLLPNEPCNLGSINLSLFVKNSEGPMRGASQHDINWDELRETVHLAIRFLDNVIDVNNYPLPEIEILAKGNRRVGLGVMGWAEMLVKMGLPYDSAEAVDLARSVMKFINDEALKASEQLAVDRGVFPNWKNSIFDPNGKNFRGAKNLPRHCARTTIAPTGTIGLAAGLQGAGIEPFYAIAYTRYTANALIAVKEGRAPDPQDIYFEVNPLFKRVAEENNYFGLGEKELWKRIEANRKSVRNIPEIPKVIQDLFATSHDVPVDGHVRMQAAFQEQTDNAVSKTINLPNGASQDDVARAFRLAYETGCKGITIYRDGSKQQQVLNIVSDDKRTRRARDFSIGVSSEYYEIKTGHGPLHVHIDFDDQGPFRVFVSIHPVGTEIAGLASTVGIMISKYLENGGDPNKLLRHLQAVKGDRSFGLGENKVNSIPHAIGIALKSHLKKHGWFDPRVEEEDLAAVSGQTPMTDDGLSLELWNLNHASDQCPKCFSSNISFNSGCSGPLCQDCGFSECS